MQRRGNVIPLGSEQLIVALQETSGRRSLRDCSSVVRIIQTSLLRSQCCGRVIQFALLDSSTN